MTVQRTWVDALTVLGSGGLDVATDDTLAESYFDGLASDHLMAGEAAGQLCQGRLTLTTATPVTTADVTAATTLYFTPFRGSYLSLWDASQWTLYQFAERSLDISALTADTNYDIYIYDNAGTLTLSPTAWTNDTTRATALAMQNGIYCKTGALAYRYLGTIRITSVLGQCEDSTSRRFVWNYYNRVRRPMFCVDATDSWTYTSATVRAVNANTTDGVGRVAFVLGVSEDLVRATAHALASNDTGGITFMTGIGLDVTNANNAQVYGGKTGTTYYIPGMGLYEGFPGIGAHFLQQVEAVTASGTTTFIGDSGTTLVQTGMTAELVG